MKDNSVLEGRAKEFYQKYNDFLGDELEKQGTWLINLRQVVWGKTKIDYEKIFLMRCYDKKYNC